MKPEGIPPNRWESSLHAVDLIDGRWTVAVLTKLRDGGCRYQELGDSLDGVSHKVLTDTLQRAERNGLIARHLNPGRVETATLYGLNDLGRFLDEPLVALERWSDDNWSLVEAARLCWDQREL